MSVRTATGRECSVCILVLCVWLGSVSARAEDARAAASTPATTSGGASWLKRTWSALTGKGESGGGRQAGGGTREIPVVAAAARKGDLDIFMDGLGTVTALNTVTVRSRVDGQLMKVVFSEGQLVHEGDLLAEIDQRPYLVQLEQAEGQQARDRAQLENARVDLARYRRANNTVTEQQIATQEALVGQFEGTVKIDQAAIDNAKLQLVYSRITAPFTGRIGLRLVDVGNIVRANDPTGMAVLTQLQPISVVFNLPQDNISVILKRMSAVVELPVLAYDRELKQKLATGTLLALDNQVDPATGTVKLKAKFPNEDGSLFPNQFVNARLKVDTLHGAVLIPSAAVQRGPSWMYSYVVKADSTVAMRPLTLGPVEGDTTAVSSGLEAGEIVVTDGADKLIDGTKVSAHVVAPGGGGKRGEPPATARAGQ